MKKYNKLIRDRIPEIIEEKGHKCVTHVADEEEFYTKLKEKLSEEVSEFLEDDNIDELADIQEVLLAILSHKNIPIDELEKVRKEKKEKRGGFDKKIILEESG